MSWISAVGRFFTGGVVQTVGDVAKASIEAGTDQAQANVDDVVSARAFAAPGSGGSGFDDLVNGCNRMIRPVVTVYVLGGLAGAWKLPDLSKADPLWLAIALVIVTFWFGGRMLVKDLPLGIAAAVRFWQGRR